MADETTTAEANVKASTSPAKGRVVRLDPAYCPPGSGATIKGETYVVGEGSTLVVPTSVTDDELKVALGASLRLS